MKSQQIEHKWDLTAVFAQIHCADSCFHYLCSTWCDMCLFLNDSPCSIVTVKQDKVSICRWIFCFEQCVIMSHAGRRRLPWDEHRSHKKSLGGFSARILHLRLHWRPSQRLPPEKRRSEAGAAPSITGAETPEEHVQLCTKKTTISYLCLNEF